MKWKIYRLCSLYNMLASFAYLCLLTFFYVMNKPGDGLSFVLVLIMPLVLAGIKNRMGLQLLKNLEEKTTHRDRFGLAFVFLWFVNLLASIALVLLVINMTGDWNGFPGSNAMNVTIFSSLYVGVITMSYTICLDMILERKVRKQYNISDELLQDNENPPFQ